jgi:hypothetical protein
MNNIQPIIKENFILENIYTEKYINLYKKYINEEFSTTIITFCNRIILESKNLSEQIKSISDLNKKFLNIIKKLLMNEYELTLFSLYFDNINFNNKNNIKNDLNTEKIFIYLGLYIKQITNDYFREIFEYFNEQKLLDSIENFHNWKKEFLQTIKNDYIYNQQIINNRFKLLNRPFNIYCTNNYIDYNCVVDKILKMSLPYNDNKFIKEDSLNNVEENIYLNQINNNNNLIIDNKVNINKKNKKSLNFNNIPKFKIKKNNDNISQQQKNNELNKNNYINNDKNKILNNFNNIINNVNNNNIINIKNQMPVNIHQINKNNSYINSYINSLNSNTQLINNNNNYYLTPLDTYSYNLN